MVALGFGTNCPPGSRQVQAGRTGIQRKRLFSLIRKHSLFSQPLPAGSAAMKIALLPLARKGFCCHA